MEFRRITSLPPYVFTIIDSLNVEARRSGRDIVDPGFRTPDLASPARLLGDARAKGPAYAVSTDAQRRRIVEATRLSGLVFDPVYTGKALSGLWDLCESGELAGKRVLFLHTGGLPGLLAQGHSFTGEV